MNDQSNTETSRQIRPAYDPQVQMPVENIPDREWDVVVVGTGPSGATCARLLAEKGHAVLAIDKERFPRHKVCGDLLVPDALGMLRRLGLYDRIAAMAHHSRAIEVSSPSGYRFDALGEFLTLSRKRLDYEILKYATEAGACAAWGNVTAVEPSHGKEPAIVRLSGPARTLRARMVVLATGGVVDLAQHMGLVAKPEPSAVAVRCYVRSPQGRENTIISYDRSILPGYGWVIPLGKDSGGAYLYNVGCGTSYRHVREGQHSLKKTLHRFIETFAPAWEIMEDAEVISPVAGASLRCGIEREGKIGVANVLGIGETIGTTYPFTGEGIGKGMETGALAAAVIDEMLRSGGIEAPGRFRKALEGIRPRYEGYEIAERWLANASLNDYMSKRIARSRYLQDKVQRFLAETDNPRSLFSWKSLIWSYFR